jgi:hypothetical protein
MTSEGGVSNTKGEFKGYFGECRDGKGNAREYKEISRNLSSRSNPTLKALTRLSIQQPRGSRYKSRKLNIRYSLSKT